MAAEIEDENVIFRLAPALPPFLGGGDDVLQGRAPGVAKPAARQGLRRQEGQGRQGGRGICVGSGEPVGKGQRREWRRGELAHAVRVGRLPAAAPEEVGVVPDADHKRVGRRPFARLLVDEEFEHAIRSGIYC